MKNIVGSHSDHRDSSHYVEPFHWAVLSPGLKRIEIRRDVAAVFVSDSHFGHRGVRIDQPGMLNPPGDVFRRVRQLAGNKNAITDSCKWRAHEAIGTDHSGNHVTTVAAIFTNLVWTARGLTMH